MRTFVLTIIDSVQARLAALRNRLAPDPSDAGVRDWNLSAEELLIKELKILLPLTLRAGKTSLKELIEHALSNGGRDELEEAKRAFLGDEDLYAQLPDNVAPF